MKTILKGLLFLALMSWEHISLAEERSIEYFVLGVITSSEDKGAVALLKHKPTGKVSAQKVGAKLGSIKLFEIHRKFVLFEKNNEKLKVMVGSDDPTKYEAQPKKPSSLNLAEGMQKSGNELRVQSALKEKLLTQDLPNILMQAAAEPYVKDGSILGFKLWEIEKNSIYEQAGFVDGDLITHINGMPLTGAGNAIKTLKSLRNAADVEITYITKGIEKNLMILVQ